MSSSDGTIPSIWGRARPGAPVVVFGEPPPDPPDGRSVVRVDLESEGSGTLGPLDAARRRIERHLGEEVAWWDESLDRLGMSAATRFLGDTEQPTIEATLVGAANRLAVADGDAALVLQSLERADEATLATLADVFRRKGWLKLPVVLHFRRRPVSASSLALLDAVRHAGEAVELGAAPAQSQSEASDHPPFDWSELPKTARRVLRAAAVVGTTFEVSLVASVLEIPQTAVLDALQQAVDHGAPLADHGRGRLRFPDGAAEVLKERMLPSLVEAYHRRLAQVLSEGQPTRPKRAPRRRTTAAPDEPPRPSVAPRAPAPRSPSESRGDPKAKAPDPPKPSAPRAKRAERARARQAEPPAEAREGADPARAARHFEAAGEADRGIERYLQAIGELDRRGDSRRALLLGERALEAVERLPATPGRAAMRGRVLLAMGRVQWRGAGLGPAMTLHGALQTLETAQATLGDRASPQLRAELASAIAGVCYDLGDNPSIERALTVLTETSEALLERGAPRHAARLLNDQAAVYLRGGDTVRANHLVRRSREIYDNVPRSERDDPVVRRERADTDHLLARLPLHARLVPDREDDAWSLALGHARAAAQAYELLDAWLEVGRVWETMGRLELRAGRIERAAERLDAAWALQTDTGDASGLARTAAALADIYLAAGDPQEAARAVAESIRINYEKGSPVGLAYNRRALAAIREASGPRTPSSLRAIEEELAAAQEVLGTIELPGELS